MITEIRNLFSRVCGIGRLVSETQGLGIPLSEVGFPIRKSTDQSFFAAPRGLSQRSTSFIASQRQGIHQMPLRHLIALITQCPLHRRLAANPFSGIGDVRRSLSHGTSLRPQPSAELHGTDAHQKWTFFYVISCHIGFHLRETEVTGKTFALLLGIEPAPRQAR